MSNPTVETCEVPTGVSRIEPGTMRATTLLERDGDERFGAGTSSIVVGDELWLGSFRAQRLLRVPRRLLARAGRRARRETPARRRCGSSAAARAGGCASSCSATSAASAT